MKKACLFLSIALGALALSAQVPEHPRDTNLFYYWWYEDIIANDSQRIYISLTSDCYMYEDSVWFTRTSPNTSCHEAAMYMYTDTPLPILGIRICGLSMMGEWPPDLDPANYSENLNIGVYEKEGDSMISLAQKHVLLDNQFRHHSQMYINLREMPNYQDSCYFRYTHGAMPYREYYFDSPVTVSDSFFLSATFDGYIQSTQSVGDITFYNVCSRHLLSESCTFGVDHFPKFRYRYRIGIWDPYTHTYTIQNNWKDTVGKFYLLIFPIINRPRNFLNI